MAESMSSGRIRVARLILVPAAITLAVTLLRLVGELRNWSEVWFNRAPGGPGAVVGIVWLAMLFGVYFALKLSKAGEGPASKSRAIGMGALGVAVVIGGFFLVSALNINFYGQLLLACAIFTVGALIQYPAWPALFKTLLAYGLAARVPVAIIMFLAMQGNWGTHYDAVNPDGPQDLTLLSKWFWYGLLPQLFMWVGFTIITGSLLGSIATAVLHRRKPISQAATG